MLQLSSISILVTALYVFKNWYFIQIIFNLTKSILFFYIYTVGMFADSIGNRLQLTVDQLPGSYSHGGGVTVIPGEAK